MATTSTSTAVAAVAPVFTEPERLALAGFLAGYTGLTARRTHWTCASTHPGASWIFCAPVSGPRLDTRIRLHREGQRRQHRLGEGPAEGAPWSGR